MGNPTNTDAYDVIYVSYEKRRNLHYLTEYIYIPKETMVYVWHTKKGFASDFNNIFNKSEISVWHTIPQYPSEHRRILARKDCLTPMVKLNNLKSKIQGDIMNMPWHGTTQQSYAFWTRLYQTPTVISDDLEPIIAFGIMEYNLPEYGACTTYKHGHDMHGRRHIFGTTGGQP